jgi:nitroimidazol reductase NimA-like FMN-containing flavoprotein (pyridoxamine 5'-phosphate oxidase superfamily)
MFLTHAAGAAVGSRPVSRREQIKMSAAEVAAFLAQERTVTCATGGPRGWPHLMPLWYVVRQIGDLQASGEEDGPRLWSWTYAVSQKVRNLERDPRATLQVEAGESYEQLRGVMLECDVIIHRDLETVSALGHEIFVRYATPREQPPVEELPAEVGAMVDKQAAKRVALEFVEHRRASWDHRKLTGTY